MAGKGRFNPKDVLGRGRKPSVSRMYAPGQPKPSGGGGKRGGGGVSSFNPADVQLDGLEDVNVDDMIKLHELSENHILAIELLSTTSFGCLKKGLKPDVHSLWHKQALSIETSRHMFNCS